MAKMQCGLMFIIYLHYRWRNYGVFLSRRQLDEAVAGSSNSPTKLIRNLLSVFFTRETLAGSSAFGSRTNPPLDREIVSACIHKFIRIVVLALSSNYTLVAFKIQSLLLLDPNRVCAVIPPGFKKRPCRCYKRQMCKLQEKEILS